MLYKFSRFCAFVERVVGIICLGLVFCIVIAMTCQVFFRYALNYPLSYTDEISLISLTWLTFLGAGWIYRRREHITVELISGPDPTSPTSRILDIFGQIAIIVILVVLVTQAVELSPRALKLRLGTLELSRFVMHFLPLMIGSGLMILFAAEHGLNSFFKKKEPEDNFNNPASE